MPQWREAGGKGVDVNLDYDPAEAAKKAEEAAAAEEMENKRNEKILKTLKVN